MDKSTGTSGSDTRASVKGPSAAAPALAYHQPQPRLPYSEASPPEQPDTFMRPARAPKVLAELRDTGLVHVSRNQYHGVIRILLPPQNLGDTPVSGVSEKTSLLPDTPETGVSKEVVPLPVTPTTGVTETRSSGPDTLETGASGNRATPETGVASTPETGVTNVSRSVLDVQAAVADVRGTPEDTTSLTRRQQQQQQRNRERIDKQIEGLFAAISSRPCKLRMMHDEADERRRLEAGEIGVDEVQALADRLADEIQERRSGVAPTAVTNRFLELIGRVRPLAAAAGGGRDTPQEIATADREKKRSSRGSKLAGDAFAVLEAPDVDAPVRAVNHPLAVQLTVERPSATVPWFQSVIPDAAPGPDGDRHPAGPCRSAARRTARRGWGGGWERQRRKGVDLVVIDTPAHVESARLSSLVVMPGPAAYLRPGGGGADKPNR